MNDFPNFPNGSRWIRADFHLHTRADKTRENFYSGENDRYCADYVGMLKKRGIEFGVITNHNEFFLDEFRALRNKAKKENIFLLPGVELFVNNGKHGIHTLIVFGDSWIARDRDFINEFLTTAFVGKDRKGRCSFTLLETLSNLEKNDEDFLIVCAHVEEKNGLWNELDGGPIAELGQDPLFQKYVLAFQQVRTHTKRKNVRNWLNGRYPAEVEGSDPKNLDEIGKGKPCWLKIGDFSFGAIQYTLHDYENRITLDEEKTREKHSSIKSISFEGGILDGKTVNLSPELNTLIGIRGSGKSAILETVRYVLDIPFGGKALDLDYKKGLVNYALGSGGKATLRAVDERGQEYEIRRINKEAPDIYVDGVHRPGISIRETILRKPVYFGQKDLSSTGVGFEKDLVEKLVGEKAAQIRQRTEAQKTIVVELVMRLRKLADAREKKKEYEAQKSDAAYRLGFYKKHGVEEKLQKQVGFDADFTKCQSVVKTAVSYLEGLHSFIEQYEDDLKNERVYTSEQNAEFFGSFFTCYEKLIVSFERIKGELVVGNAVLEELRGGSAEFSKLVESLKEEFAEIERKLAEELKESGAKAIDLNEFRTHRRRFDDALQMIEAVDKEELTRANLHNELMSELATLNNLWHEEYAGIKTELEKVNENHSSLSIDVEYKGDRNAFVSFMKESFKGSKIRETTFQNLAQKFQDFVAMYKEPEILRNELGASETIFSPKFDENLAALLTYQVPNKFTIKYRGKELKDHSLGQRASALILFVLSQRDNDVFIIDQPEDDLDNQTIYEDVIKLIRQLKPNAQFVFATHNPNFPVLGDAEQIVACSCQEDNVEIQYGSIDAPDMQQKIIDIMEGGQEAFRLREGRYNIWKRQNSSK